MGLGKTGDSPVRGRSPVRLFVAGTDTGVGKTQVAAALLALLAERGMRPAPFKPYESGCQDLRRPQDALTLRAAARSDDALDDICPHRFRAPLAPGVAAARLGRAPKWSRTLEAFRRFDGRSLIAEAAGGLLVPLDAKREVIDLIQALALPVVLVARAGLGTLNHTALSIEALRARRVAIHAVVLVRSTPERDASQRDNARWIQRRHGVRVLGPLPYCEDESERRRRFARALAPLLLAR